MSASADLLCIGKGERDIFLLPRMANRHGLIAGATGTGKTVTLQTLAEQFSEIGVPVFLADIKGDLSGLARPGGESRSVADKITALNMGDFPYRGYPVAFWDVFGEMGHPVRTTISEIGPLLLARILNLNDTQTSVLSVIFKIADDNGLLLLDTKDLRALLDHVSKNTRQYMSDYGTMSVASIGAIQRNLLALDGQGGKIFFGEPALNLQDLLQTDARGKGMINILAADRLVQAPAVYSTFLLWMISELFEQLPEIGDRDKPTLVFFFDEAHLLFRDTPKTLLDKIEQVVRLIRSKGVGIYFVTQSPLDIPETVLGQLGNRVQHALRAYTPKDQKAVRTAALTFRQNPSLEVEKAISELAVGEALISFLDAQGVPVPVERVSVYPPHSHIGPISDADRKTAIKASMVYGYYETAVDRESAYEILKKRAGSGSGDLPQQPVTAVSADQSTQQTGKAGDQNGGVTRPVLRPQPGDWGSAAPSRNNTEPSSSGLDQRPAQSVTVPQPQVPNPSYIPPVPPVPQQTDRSQKVLQVESMANTAIRIADSEIGRMVVRGVLGSILGKKNW